MADLQAAAAAANLLANLAGRPATATFKTELVCIVDAIDQGSLVYRTTDRNMLVPNLRVLHLAKRLFESFCFSLHSIGMPVAVACPCPVGPRNSGQSSAHRAIPVQITNAITLIRVPAYQPICSWMLR